MLPGMRTSMGKGGEAAEMFDFIIFIVGVPLMAFFGLAFLGATFGIIYRDVLRIDDKVSEWFDRQFGTGYGLGQPRKHNRLLLLGLAVIIAFIGYACLRYGVVEPIAEYVFGDAR